VSKVLEVEETKVTKTAELAEMLSRISRDLQSAIDLTIQIRRESPQSRNDTIRLWEDFLGGFFGYIKQRSKETKDNLLSGISLTRMRFF